jgi:hypothetical protein
MTELYSIGELDVEIIPKQVPFLHTGGLKMDPAVHRQRRYYRHQPMGQMPAAQQSNFAGMQQIGRIIIIYRWRQIQDL